MTSQNQKTNTQHIDQEKKRHISQNKKHSNFKVSSPTKKLKIDIPGFMTNYISFMAVFLLKA